MILYDFHFGMWSNFFVAKKSSKHVVIIVKPADSITDWNLTMAKERKERRTTKVKFEYERYFWYLDFIEYP